MDLSKSIVYRTIDINNVENQSGDPTSGLQVTYAAYGGVLGVGYTEKRSLGDGNDAGDVFLGVRRFRLRGGIYGQSLAELYDQKQVINTLFTPTAAYSDDPGEYGYLPLFWFEPTGNAGWDIDDEEAGDEDHIRGYKHLYALVRPLASPEIEYVRGKVGGKTGRGGALVYTVALEAKDPRIYIYPPRCEAFYVPGEGS